MPDIFKFPNGYDVTVCRKEDILKCIDENITDKEVVLAVIEQCEIDAATFMKEGRWTGIPYMGNLRIPKRQQILGSKDTKELFEDAKETLDRDKYVLFRQEFDKEISRSVKTERYFNYILSKFVTKNRRFYKRRVEEMGERYAKFYCYTLMNLTSIYKNVD